MTVLNGIISYLLLCLSLYAVTSFLAFATLCYFRKGTNCNKITVLLDAISWPKVLALYVLNQAFESDTNTKYKNKHRYTPRNPEMERRQKRK